MSDQPPQPSRLNIRIDQTGIRVYQHPGTNEFSLELGNSSVRVRRKAVRDLIAALTQVDNLIRSEEDGSCALSGCTNPRQGFSDQCEHHNNYR